MLRHLDRVLGNHAPITADIFLTNYCNNKCPYCTYGRWELDAGAYAMKYEEFVTYADRLRSLGVEGMILTGGGEPTLNPDFDKITEYLEENGISYGINTNFNNIRFFAPNYLKVSLDGYDEESYKAKRGVQKYAQVRENIKTYAEWKKKHSPSTILGIQTVATNVDDVKKFYEANRDLDVDYIVIRPIESTGGNYYRSSGKQSEALSIIEAVKAIHLTDERVSLNFKWNLLDEREDSCLAQWAQIALNERGEVMYCCHKPYEIVGHVMDDDILEKKAAFMTDMSMCDVPCRMTAPNMLIGQMGNYTRDDCFI